MPRFGHGSRVPGWDRPPTSARTPPGCPIPRPPRCPSDLRAEIEAPHGQLPRPPLGRAARAGRGPARARLVLAPGDRPGGLRDAPDPGLPDAVATFYDMLETEPGGPPQHLRVHEHLLLAAAGPTRCTRRSREAAGEDPEFNVRSFECLGACDIAPMASVDGVYVGPLAPTTSSSCSTTCAPGARCCPTSSWRAAAVADPHANSREFPAPGSARGDGRRASAPRATRRARSARRHRPTRPPRPGRRGRTRTSTPTARASGRRWASRSRSPVRDRATRGAGRARAAGRARSPQPRRTPARGARTQGLSDRPGRGHRRRAPAQDARTRARTSRWRPRRSCSEGHRRAGPEHARGVRAPRRL